MKGLFLRQFGEDKAQPSWLAELRRSAFDRLDRLGYPTTHQEEWRYTSVESLKAIPFEGADVVGSDGGGVGAAIESDLAEKSAFVTSDDLRLVFVNGHYDHKLSSLKSLPRGMVVRNFGENFGEDLPNAPRPLLAILEEHLARVADFEDRPFVALNTSLIQDGAVLFLPRRTVVAEPIFLCHYSWAGGRPIVSHPRNLIVAEEGSQATIVEIYIGGGEGAYFSNSVTEVVAGPESRIDHYTLQQESGKAFHIGSLDIHQERASRFSSFVISLGGCLSRNEVRTVLADDGAECELNGFSMVTGRQHVDNQTSIDHARPYGTSSELYKGILDGNATGVFNGRILVRPDAQKTSARQVNKNLILSDQALVNSKPLLEIFANDVKCNHGATIGRLDEDQIFYLRSRGMGEFEARGLLTYAFASDLIAQIRIASLRKALEGLIFRRLLVSGMEGVAQ